MQSTNDRSNCMIPLTIIFSKLLRTTFVKLNVPVVTSASVGLAVEVSPVIFKHKKIHHFIFHELKDIHFIIKFHKGKTLRIVYIKHYT